MLYKYRMVLAHATTITLPVLTMNSNLNLIAGHKHVSHTCFPSSEGSPCEWKCSFPMPTPNSFTPSE